MQRWIASDVCCEIDVGDITIGFASADDAEGEYLILQRQIPSTAREAENGLNQFYVEAGFQLRSGYGGISSIQMGSGKVTIKFDDALAENLQTDQIEVTLNTKSCSLDSLIDHLKLLADGSSILKL